MMSNSPFPGAGRVHLYQADAARGIRDEATQDAGLLDRVPLQRHPHGVPPGGRPPRPRSRGMGECGVTEREHTLQRSTTDVGPAGRGVGVRQ